MCVTNFRLNFIREDKHSGKLKGIFRCWVSIYRAWSDVYRFIRRSIDRNLHFPPTLLSFAHLVISFLTSFRNKPQQFIFLAFFSFLKSIPSSFSYFPRRMDMIFFTFMRVFVLIIFFAFLLANLRFSRILYTLHINIVCMFFLKTPRCSNSLNIDLCSHRVPFTDDFFAKVQGAGIWISIARSDALELNFKLWNIAALDGEPDDN